MGWGEGEAVGRIKCQRGRRRIGHGMSEGTECLDISSGESSVLSWSGDMRLLCRCGSGGSNSFRARASCLGYVRPT